MIFVKGSHVRALPLRGYFYFTCKLISFYLQFDDLAQQQRQFKYLIVQFYILFFNSISVGKIRFNIG